MIALIIEDSINDASIIRKALQNVGLTAVICASTDEAISTLTDNNCNLEQQACGLVVLGLDNSGTRANAFCRELRSMPEGKLCTILMLKSADTPESIINAALESGVNDFLNTPVNEDELRLRLKIARNTISRLKERKKTEEERRLNEARLEAILKLGRMINASLNTIADFAIERGAELTKSEVGFMGFLTADRCVLDIYAWSAKTIQTCKMMVPPRSMPLDKAGIWSQAITKRQPLIVNDYLAGNLNKNGLPDKHIHITRFLSVPVFENDEVVGIAAVGNKATDYDDTDVRQLTLLMEGMLNHIRMRKDADELAKAKQASEQASRTKSEFLAKMSHEIRTPMNAIVGITDLLLDTPLNSDQQEQVNMLQFSAETLLTITDDILDISKVEANKLELHPTVFSLKDDIGTMLRTMSNRAREKGVKLDIEKESCIPDLLYGDPVRLTQVLINLVGNAIKFTHKGIIKLTMKTHKIENKKIWISFSISDSGIGIPADHIEHIFDPFSQANNTIFRKYGGAGLGLAISSALVKMMGGTIKVSSESGRGSTFHFTICFHIPKPDRASRDTALLEQKESFYIPQTRPLRILLAEDNEINQKIATRMLEKAGHLMRIARNGSEAVTLYKSGEFDLILMDLEMPDMNGYEATRAIRKDEKKAGSHTPIIAMTAHAMSGYREKCIEAGMDEYISKPIRSSDLLRIISTVTLPKKSLLLPPKPGGQTSPPAIEGLNADDA